MSAATQESPSNAQPLAGPAEASGNPVFDFRAAFRRRAGTWQRWLMRVGTLAALAGAGTLAFGVPGPALNAAAGWSLGLGVAALAAGVAWGFYWRNRLRADFQKTYGPQSPEPH